MIARLIGPTAAKSLRKLGYVGPIIGVTGNVLREDVEHFVAHGASEVVGKPLRPNSVQQILQRYGIGIDVGNKSSTPRDLSSASRKQEQLESARQLVLDRLRL